MPAAIMLGILVLFLAPVTARAQSPVFVYDQPTLEEAINSYEIATEDIVIAVTADFYITSGLSIPANDYGASLIIKSVDAANPVTLTSNNRDNSLFFVDDGAKLIMEDIIIDGNKAAYSGNPQLIFIYGGEFTMEDGVVLMNNDGCGVRVAGFGTFIMHGGQIADNNGNSIWEGYGGGVYVLEGTFTMTGGIITGNRSSVLGYGGGVYVNTGEFNLGGDAIISNNNATMGGGVFCNNSSDASFNMTGGKITGNTSDFGGGVYNSCAFAMTGGEISGNNGVGVYHNYSFIVGGTAVVNGNTNGNVDLGGAYIALSTETPPVPGMNVGVQTNAPSGVFVNSGASASYAQYFFADEPGKVVVYRNNQLMIVDSDYVIYGDANGDGDIDLADVTRLRRFLAGHPVEINNLTADANSDGDVDLADVTRLRRYLAGHPVILGPTQTQTPQFAFQMFAFQALATGEVNVSASHETVAPGEYVDVVVSLDENPGLLALQLCLEYDETVLEAVGIIPGSLIPIPVQPPLSANPLPLNFEGAAFDKIFGTGVLATVRFRVLDEAESGSFDIKLDGIYAGNALEESFTITTVDGSVNVISDVYLTDDGAVKNGMANINIFGYETVSVTRVGLTAYDYTIKANAINNGVTSTKNVTAVLAGLPPNTTLIGDGTFIFGDITAGETVKSENTITIRLERTAVFDESKLDFIVNTGQ